MNFIKRCNGLHDELQNGAKRMPQGRTKKLKLKIAKEPHLSKNSRAFAISTDLLRESIAMKITQRMDLDAIKAGNVVSSSMIKANLKHKSLMASSHFYNFFIFFNIF